MNNNDSNRVTMDVSGSPWDMTLRSFENAQHDGLNPDLMRSISDLLSRMCQSQITPPDRLLTLDRSLVIEWQNNGFVVEVEIEEPWRAEIMSYKVGEDPEFMEIEWAPVSGTIERFYYPTNAATYPDHNIRPNARSVIRDDTTIAA